jgi:CubicO group peptidase (beta-lactamase class C family)
MRNFSHHPKFKKMKTLVLFGFFAFIVNFSFAQKPNTSNESATMVSQDRLLRIDHTIQEYVDNEWINGAEVMVYHKNDMIYHKAIGYRDLEEKTPLEKNSIYRMASQTKLLTTLGIMMLLEQGEFLLDDPISNFLPEFKNPMVLDSYNELDTTFTTIPSKREITFKDLLTHTSGIGYPQIGSPQMTAIYHKSGIFGGLGIVDEVSIEDQMKRLAKSPLFHHPGERFTYGLNIDLLGYLIETISGRNLSEFFQQEFFNTLQMEDTYFFLPQEKWSRLVPLYLEKNDQKVEKSGTYFNIGGQTLADYPNTKGNYYSGGAGLSSTAKDFTTFLRMIVNGGEFNGVKFLSKSPLRLMTSNQLGNLEFTMDANGNKFGLGLILISDQSGNINLMTPGSYEGGGAFSTWFWMDPKKEIIGQIMINKIPNSRFELIRKIQNMVYQALD